MSEIQSEENGSMSSLAEASELIEAIGGNAGSKKAKRLKVWRMLSAHFTWNRIGDLHRGHDLRVRVSGDELNLLRAAARREDEAERGGRKEYRELVARIARLESRLMPVAPDDGGAGDPEMQLGVGMAGDDNCALDQG